MRRNTLLLVMGLVAAVGPTWAQASAASPCDVLTPTLKREYLGDCEAGLASGHGRAAGIDRYEGEWREGQPNGQGVYTFADGRRFEGEFSNGRVNGQARFVFGNGDVLEGRFVENHLVGVGRLRKAAGGEQPVEWHDGRLVEAAAAAAPEPLSPSPSPPPPPAPPSLQANAADANWSPSLDLEDFFPAYLLAIATIDESVGPDTSRDFGKPAATPKAELAGFSVPRPRNEPDTQGATARMMGDSKTHYLGDPYGLVGIHVHGTRPGSVVAVRVGIDEIAEPTEATFTLPEAGDYDLFPHIHYRYDKLRSVAQPIPVNVSWQVSIDGRDAGSRMRVARVRSIQDAPISAKTPRGEEDLAWVFAGFVNEDATWIDDLIHKAFAGQSQVPFGYQGTEDEVSKQVEIIYQYLRRSGFNYSSITTGSGMSKNVFSQIVRFPSDSVRTAQANCIDGTVLMASILRKIGIEPLIVLGPGHAMLGYYLAKDIKQGFIVVDTTVLGQADFAIAVREGSKEYDEWVKKDADNPAFKRIPVFAARAVGVMPIAH